MAGDVKERNVVSELGAALHTALRKACDSPWTSVAYNAVDIMRESWTEYLAAVADARTPEELKALSLKWGNEDDGPWKIKGERGIALIFWIALENFSPDDWRGFGCYLPDVFEAERGGE